MRLIDADALARKLQDEYHGAISDSELKVYQVLALLEEQPTAYDVDKVLKKLDERCRDEDRKYLTKIGYVGELEYAPVSQRSVGLFEAIGIVKVGGKNE